MHVAPPTSRDRFFLNTKTKKVGLFIYNPKVDGVPFSEYMEWNDPQELVDSFISDIHEVSRRTYKYEIVHTEILDEVTTLADGFQYDTKSLRRVISGLEPAHSPMPFDYSKFIVEHSILENIADRTYDEVWIMAYPYAGLWESTMAGPNAFWCNSSPIPNTDIAEHRFVIMGFNYERGAGEMLESYLHRAESIMSEVYRFHPPRKHMWNRFTMIDKTSPGQAAIGTCHFAPNSTKDYDWANPAKVMSSCGDWEMNYPNLQGTSRMVTCEEWGNGDIRLHHLWWLKHLPHWPRTTDGVFNNWWHYIMTPDWVKV